MSPTIKKKDTKIYFYKTADILKVFSLQWSYGKVASELSMQLVLLTSSGATLIPFHFEVPIYFKVYIDITLSDQVCQSHVTV